MNKIYAIITGDIVSSSKMDRKFLLKDLKELLNRITPPQNREDLLAGFELYRGDSFQGTITVPQEALKYAFIIRAHLKKISHGAEGDARIAIGIGKIEFPASSVAESDGEAFRNSGPVLDTMKNGVRIKVKTPWEDINQEMEVSLTLAETIVSRWSASQAEVIVARLEDSTQTEIASKLGISQSAVNQRLKAAQWEALEKLTIRFQELITRKL